MKPLYDQSGLRNLDQAYLFVECLATVGEGLRVSKFLWTLVLQISIAMVEQAVAFQSPME